VGSSSWQKKGARGGRGKIFKGVSQMPTWYREERFDLGAGGGGRGRPHRPRTKEPNQRKSKAWEKYVTQRSCGKLGERKSELDLEVMTTLWRREHTEEGPIPVGKERYEKGVGQRRKEPTVTKRGRLSSRISIRGPCKAANISQKI